MALTLRRQHHGYTVVGTTAVIVVAGRQRDCWPPSRLIEHTHSFPLTLLMHAIAERKAAERGVGGRVIATEATRPNAAELSVLFSACATVFCGTVVVAVPEAVAGMAFAMFPPVAASLRRDLVFLLLQPMHHCEPLHLDSVQRIDFARLGSRLSHGG